MSNSANWKKQKIQLRRGTAAEWTARNTLLLAGEQGYETDTGRQKIGDGVTRWNQLSYWAAGGVAPDDPRFTDAREWTAETISQAEAEGGVSTSRRAFTALRVFQAAAAWWAGSSAKAKLDGIANGATANASDAELRDRATHTGTQAISTVSGLQTALDNTVQSVAGRTGAVFLFAADITPNPTDAANLASGTVPYARLPVGTTASTVCAGDDARLSDSRPPTSHTHGNISNAGAIGTTSNLPVITGTSGVLQAGSFGATANTFCQGDDSRLSDARTPTDNTVSTAKLQDNAVTYAKIQNVSATDRLLGRSSSGAGNVEEITCTAFGRSLIDDADAAAGRATLGAAPTASPTFTGVVTIPVGSNSAPSLTFTGDANTGLAQLGGADSLSIVTNGGERLRVDGTHVNLYGSIRSSLRFNSSFTTSGTDVGVLSFFNNSGTQIGRMDCTSSAADETSTGTFRFQTRDSEGTSANSLLVSSSSVTSTRVVVIPVGSNSAPSLTFSGDLNTGVFRHAADVVGIACGGLTIARVGMEGLTVNHNLLATETATTFANLGRPITHVGHRSAQDYATYFHGYHSGSDTGLFLSGYGTSYNVISSGMSLRSASNSYPNATLNYKSHATNSAAIEFQDGNILFRQTNAGAGGAANVSYVGFANASLIAERTGSVAIMGVDPSPASLASATNPPPSTLYLFNDSSEINTGPTLTFATRYSTAGDNAAIGYLKFKRNSGSSTGQGTTRSHFVIATGDYASGAYTYVERVVVDGVTGALGVNSLGAAANPAIYIGGDTDTGLFQAASSANTLSVATNGTERLRVDSSGRLGIATTSPTATLDVNGTIRATNLTDGTTTKSITDVLAGGAGVTDGDKGDIVVSSSGATWSIDSGVLSSFGRSLIDDADAAGARTTLGLGSLATVSPTGTADATTFLRGDGSWATPSGGGGLTGYGARLLFG